MLNAVFWRSVARSEINDSISISFCFLVLRAIRRIYVCVCVYFYWIHPQPLLCLFLCHSVCGCVTLKTISFELFRRSGGFFFFFYLFKRKVSFELLPIFRIFLSFTAGAASLQLRLTVHSAHSTKVNKPTDVYSHLQCNIEKI